MFREGTCRESHWRVLVTVGLLAFATSQINTCRKGHRLIPLDILNDDYLVELLPTNDRRDVKL